MSSAETSHSSNNILDWINKQKNDTLEYATSHKYLTGSFLIVITVTLLMLVVKDLRDTAQFILPVLWAGVFFFWVYSMYKDKKERDSF